MSVSLKQSYDVEYNGTANVSRMDLFVDTVADLAGLDTFDDIKLLQGSTAHVIQTVEDYMMRSNGIWVSQSSGGGGGSYSIVPITVDLSSETWENRNFANGSSNFVLTCNKIVEIPEGAVSVSAEITLTGGNRSDSCFQFFADASQVESYDKTDASSYTNNDYADGWQSTSESKHILPYLSGRYAFEFAIARYPIGTTYYISPSAVTDCKITFYCVM